MMLTVETKRYDETRALAKSIAQILPRPCALALIGQLGAGKTQFIKGLGEGLGLDPSKICSATFVLIAEYGEEEKLVHIDAYRLNDPRELSAVGFEELLDQQNTIVAVEWADKISTLLPEEHIEIKISILDDQRRRISIVPHGKSLSELFSDDNFIHALKKITKQI
jgi:tRNA threonylcarbamoyladenosine biosynthesis protein TsaE